MKFCMVTTFFGAESFGGDAAYVDHLSRALVRQGHEVDVVHCTDAYEAVRGGHPGRSYSPAPGLRVLPLRSRLGRLSPLWTHQTGRLGPKRSVVRRLFEDNRYDVVHCHNVSLVGGLEILALQPSGRRCVKLMTAHEFWLLCPLSSLWKLGREVCEKPACIRCTLSAGRPPQLWRSPGRRDRALAQLDALIFPSRHALEVHRARGVTHRNAIHLPYFLPVDWARGTTPDSRPPSRPYFAAAGRLVQEKGFQRLIALMDRLPETDLVIAGTGPYEPELRHLARGFPNVRLLGLQRPAQLAELYRQARALVVPSLLYETFGYVVLEAFSQGTPAIVRRHSALEELIVASGAGVTFGDDSELLEAMRSLASDDARRQQLGERGLAAWRETWSEAEHLDRYVQLAHRGAQQPQEVPRRVPRQAPKWISHSPRH